jgi:hypothetical protein
VTIRTESAEKVPGEWQIEDRLVPRVGSIPSLYYRLKPGERLEVRYSTAPFINWRQRRQVTQPLA